MRINTDNKSVDMEARDINYILPAYVRSYLFHSKNEMPEKIIFPMFSSVRAGGVDIPIEYVPPLDPIAAEISKDGSDVAEVTEEQEAALDEKDKEIAKLKAQMAELETAGRGGEEVGGTEKQPDEVGSEEPTEEADTLASRQKEYRELETNATEEATESPARTAFAKSLGESVEKAEKTHFEEEDKRIKAQASTIKATVADREPKQPPGGDIGAGQPLSDTQARDRRDQTRTANDLREEPEIEGTAEKEFEKEISRDEHGNPVVEEKPNG